ncbi:biotin/lipoyl-containing protein, partial [Sphingomonas sp.]|uniref:biotin/lipoyl-containing protein n=1 Tax=Sphingomonas sp. TaxID=28214 RepID=UPI002D7F0056
MARYSFRLPDIGEGISEAEIVAWHVAVGERVEEDGRLADMMTDKATVEMESPVAGIVVELAGEVGDQIPIGSTLVVIETDAVEGEQPSAPTPEAAADLPQAQLEAENPGVEEATTPAPFVPSEVEGPAASDLPATRVSTALDTSGDVRPPLASPAVRQRARE